jgi:hypothetical protein
MVKTIFSFHWPVETIRFWWKVHLTEHLPNNYGKSTISVLSGGVQFPEQKKCQSPGGYVADLLRGNHAFACKASFGRSSSRFLVGAELGMPMTAILKVSIRVAYFVTMIVQGIRRLSV